MDDASTQRLHLLQRRREIGHGEVGQREGVPRPGAAGMDANRRSSGVRLPALPLPTLPGLQRDAEESGPEASGSLWVVGGKLDQ